MSSYFLELNTLATPQKSTVKGHLHCLSEPPAQPSLLLHDLTPALRVEGQSICSLEVEPTLGHLKPGVRSCLGEWAKGDSGKPVDPQCSSAEPANVSIRISFQTRVQKNHKAMAEKSHT
jgi:hypothetical protein